MQLAAVRNGESSSPGRRIAAGWSVLIAGTGAGLARDWRCGWRGSTCAAGQFSSGARAALAVAWYPRSSFLPIRPTPPPTWRYSNIRVINASHWLLVTHQLIWLSAVLLARRWFFFWGFCFFVSGDFGFFGSRVFFWDADVRDFVPELKYVWLDF